MLKKVQSSQTKLLILHFLSHRPFRIRKYKFNVSKMKKWRQIPYYVSRCVLEFAHLVSAGTAHPPVLIHLC